MKNTRNKARLFFFSALATMTTFAPELAWADTLGGLLKNIKTNVLDDFYIFIQALAVIVGIFFIFNGLLKLSQRSKPGMQHQISVSEIAVSLLVGSCLIVLIIMVNAGTQTLTGQDNAVQQNFEKMQWK